jgi:hypothetical protein
MRTSQLTIDNLSTNKVLFAIINKRRFHVPGDSFADMMSNKRVKRRIYAGLGYQRDYAVARWNDSDYSNKLRTLLNEQDWMQFKRDILRIYEDQNAKRKALRFHIEFNSYRSVGQMFLIKVGYLIPLIACSYCPGQRDPLRDPTCSFRLTFFVLAIPRLLFLILAMYSMMPVMLSCILLDLLTFPRFFMYHQRHMEFLDSVITAHPELDPMLVEEELVQKLQQLIQSLSRNNPGVHCKISSYIVHHPRHGSHQSYKEDIFEIQFLKFAPEP